MIMSLLIAGAAGSASALMFASIVSGALISLLLFYLAPLPLMVAAMGWGPTSAAIGGVMAGAGLGSIFGIPYGAAFVLTVALPAWWLGHLALLGRPLPATSGGDGAAIATPPPIEWYPLGRILVWVACFAALTTTAALLTLGTDAPTITGTLRRGLLHIINAQDAAAGDRATEVVDAFVIIAPAAAATIAMMTLTLNLWLAAKVTATSGRLRRPWPDMKTTMLPPMTLVATMVALALCFTGGLAAILAQIAAASLMMTYALAGFAVLHTITLTLRSRALWLSCVYAVVLVFLWPVIAMIGIGIADALFGLRQRYLQRRMPPPLAPTS
ncbi:MAG: hypothetical protein JSS22_11935 [Proteobacteria bacterium]|nr:hypothetical protein [Pseudomonadota bacterium]